MPRKCHALPELFSPHRWKVVEGQSAGVNLTDKIIACPLGDTPREAFVRAHEMGHIRWTPEDYEGHGSASAATRDVLQAVEDNRINLLLSRAGVDLSSGGLSADGRASFMSAIMSKDVSDRDLLLGMIAAYGTGDWDVVYPVARVHRPAHVVVARMIRQELERDPSFSRTVSLVGELDLQFVATSGRSLPGMLAMYDNGRPHEDDEGEPAKLLCRVFDETIPEDKTKPFDMVPWGKMSVQEPDRPLASAMQKPRYRAEDIGSCLRGPHRLLTDARVFTTRRKYPTCSLLVDFSGSMSMTEEDLLRLLLKVPAAVVAVYAGCGDAGALRVLARDGRRVTGDMVASPSGGNNVVDGPALKWLGRQPSPRFWLSDGMVTGVGDHSGEGNRAYTTAVCKRYAIQQCYNVNQTIAAVSAAMKKMRRR